MTPRNTKFYLKHAYSHLPPEVANNVSSVPAVYMMLLCGGDGYPQPSYVVKVNGVEVSTTVYFPYQRNGDGYTRWADIPKSSLATNADSYLSCTPRFGLEDGPTATLTLKVVGTCCFLLTALLFMNFHI